MKKLCIIWVFFCCLKINAQQNDSLSFRPMFRAALTYSIKTSSGMVYVGKVLEETKYFITFEESASKLNHEFRKDQIVFYRPLSDKEVFMANLEPYGHCGIYMISASSLVYDKPFSSIHYQWFLFNNVNVSLGKHWDVTLNTLAVYPSSLGFKCAYEIGNHTYFGANAFVAGSISNQLVSNYFMGYGALARISRGQPNHNFSVSGGVLGINRELVGKNSGDPFLNVPFGSLAYCNRFKAKWAFTAEGFYFPQIYSGFGGIGFKFFNSKESAWTFGCFTYINTVNNSFSIGTKALPIPFLSYSTNFY